MGLPPLPAHAGGPAYLVGRFAPATANRILSALRGVLKECFPPGAHDAEDHARAADIPSVKGSSPQGAAP